MNAHLMTAGRQRALALGMSAMIRPIVVPAGETLYRFYDTHRAPTPQLGAEGEWWLEFTYYQAIKHFALRHEHSMSYAVRLFAAILYEYSEVNAFVACRTKVAVSCWKGRGKQVHSSGKDSRDLPTMTPMQSVLEVYQLFIPGMKSPNSMAPAAMEVVAHGLL